MKKHIIGDSYIIHKIQPIPEGFHMRDTPLIGNKYQNEELWNVYKDREDSFVTNTYHATTSGGESPMHKNTRLWFDGWKIIGLDTHFMSSTEIDYKGTGAYFNMGFVTKSGHLVFVLNGNQNVSPYGFSMRFYKTKQQVVTQTTDYQYFYDTLGENLSVDDFEWWDINMYSYTQHGSYIRPSMVYMRRDGKVIISTNTTGGALDVDKWYADDRNGTNEAWKRTTLFWIYDPETNRIEKEYTKGDLLAPKSLSKIPSSDPWNAIGNYAFDINNIEELAVNDATNGKYYWGSYSFDVHREEYFFECKVKVKEFYTTGYPETPAFNYKDMIYMMSAEGKNPIVVSYANGGSVTYIYDYPNTSNSGIFNNRFINTGDKLSGIFSSIKGVEVCQPDLNFKTTDEMSKVHTPYDYGKRIYNLSSYYLSRLLNFSTAQVWGDSDLYGTSVAYNSLINPSLPIAIPMCHHHRTDDLYLENKCFVLDGDGFRFVGDNSFLERVKAVTTTPLSNGSTYNFMAYGWEYTIGGEVLQDLYIKQLELGKAPEAAYRGYMAPQMLIHGIDSEGYYVASTSIYSSGGSSDFLQWLKTESNGTTASKGSNAVYRISPDMTEIKMYQQFGTYNRSVFTCASQDRYITRNWEKKGSSGTLFGLKAGIFYPDMQLDTFQLPIINIKDGSDYVYITKIKETETEPDMKNK